MRYVVRDLLHHARLMSSTDTLRGARSPRRAAGPLAPRGSLAPKREYYSFSCFFCFFSLRPALVDPFFWAPCFAASGFDLLPFP